MQPCRAKIGSYPSANHTVGLENFTMILASCLAHTHDTKYPPICQHLNNQIGFVV